jgi:hypothetical protein
LRAARFVDYTVIAAWVERDRQRHTGLAGYKSRIRVKHTMHFCDSPLWQAWLRRARLSRVPVACLLVWRWHRRMRKNSDRVNKYLRRIELQ